MLTALITAGITAILSLFGVKASAGLVLKIAIVVKIVIVCLGLFFGIKLGGKRKPASASPAPTPDPSAPAEKT